MIQGAIKRFDVDMIPGIAPAAIELVLPRIKFEPVLGTYDWTVLDKWIAAAAKLGVPLILGATPNDPYGYDRSDPDPNGDYFYFKNNGRYRWVPFENRPTYLLALKKFVDALGAHCNGRVQVQIRLGTFGEGTNGGFHNADVPEILPATAIAITNMYRSAFPASQKWALGDNPVVVGEAMKDAATGILVASFGKPLCDDRFAAIAYLLGSPGSRPVCAEFYGPGLTMAEMDTANLQITRWRAGWINIYNFPAGSESKVTEAVRLAKANAAPAL